jgi:3-keto steroid reductase
MIDEFITSPSTPPKKHLILILCTRTPMKTRFTISRLRGHLRNLAESSAHAKKLRAKAKAEGQEYRWETTVQRVHFLGVEVDLCDLKSVYRLADNLVNGTVGSPDATTIDGTKLPHGSPGTQSYSEDIQQDRWALSQKPGSTGLLRSWGWGLSGIRLPRIDVVILSAGIGGWTGVSWYKAVRDVLFDSTDAVTWPKFKLANFGAVVRSQSKYGVQNVGQEDTQPLLEKHAESTEPPLGEVFCSNIFGHYILAHELMPLLSRPSSPTSKSSGKIIWVSSIEAISDHFSIDDIQGLKSLHPYEDTKRLIDIISLTADLPSTKRAVGSYFDPSKTVTGRKARNSQHDAEDLPIVKPKTYLTHPGIFASEILPLPSFLVVIYKLVFLFVRWIGSPWHPIEPYKAAVAPTWLALTDNQVLEDIEDGGKNKAKWGSSTNASGEERVMQTEVDGWGWPGIVDGTSDKRIGRRRGAVDATKESRENFEILGGQCWTQLEELRATWEDVLGVKE